MTEGLRERKKRLTRQRISDTATAMFLQRGFDAVTVAEVARACEVSEKTVFNYFPTKESLVLDQADDWAGMIRAALGPENAGTPPAEAAANAIAEHVRRQYDEPALNPSAARGVAELIRRTPSLRAASDGMTAALTDLAARTIADRFGGDPDDPEPQIAAAALIGLWRVQFLSMRRHATGRASRARIRDAVIADVRRAARLIDDGLRGLG